jgi:hypothetical protein
VGEAPTLVGCAVAAGLGATLLMDLWNLFLKRRFGIASLDLCFLGRWLRHMEQGTFAHASIAAAAPRRFECVVGRLAHYGIGAGLALLFLALVSSAWFRQPTLLPALLFGVGTVVLPYFTLQPAFGLGIAAARTPRPTQARLKSLLSHTVFGVGLYFGALLASGVLRAAGD